MSDTVFSLLMRGNLALSAAILVILVVRRPMRRRFGPTAAYALWLAAPVCMLAALLPASAPAGLLPPIVATSSTLGRAGAASTQWDWRGGLAVLWLLGAVAGALIFALRQMRFARSLGRLSAWPHAPRAMISGSSHAGPLLLGVLRPRIILPVDFEDRFKGEARDLVLAHELAHLRRGDALFNAVAVGLQVVAWFNPLVHLAARRLRVDQEIACDAVVLAGRPQASRLYAEALIGAITAPVSAPLACHWPPGDAKPLKERLVMLSSPPIGPRGRALGLGFVAALSAVGAGAVWAANPAPAELIGKPTWLSRPTGDDLKTFYPAEAAKTRTGGRALIECGVAADGALKDCRVASEAPAAAGFGDAALKLSTSFRMTAVSADGKTTNGAMVRIPILFALAPEAPR